MTPGVQKRSVAVLSYDGFCTFEFALAVEIFGLRRPELGVPWYDFKVCAAAPGPLRAEGGVSLHARHGLPRWRVHLRGGARFHCAESSRRYEGFLSIEGRPELGSQVRVFLTVGSSFSKKLTLRV